MAWNVSGQLLELCNCNVVVGCWFGRTKPDQGWFGGALIFDIREGTADNVNLSGNKVALAAEWPGDFWSGNGKARLYVDAGATAEQRRELEAIFGGRRGGVPPERARWRDHPVAVAAQCEDQRSARRHDLGDHWRRRHVTLKRLKDGSGKQTKVQSAAAQGAFEIESMDVASSRWSDPELRG